MCACKGMFVYRNRKAIFCFLSLVLVLDTDLDLILQDSGTVGGKLILESAQVFMFMFKVGYRILKHSDLENGPTHVISVLLI